MIPSDIKRLTNTGDNQMFTVTHKTHHNFITRFYSFKIWVLYSSKWFYLKKKTKKKQHICIKNALEKEVKDNVYLRQFVKKKSFIVIFKMCYRSLRLVM